MNNKEILQKAKELVELLEKQEETGKVELSTLKRGEVFQTTGKRKYKVLEQYGDTTKILLLKWLSVQFAKKVLTLVMQ